MNLKVWFILVAVIIFGIAIGGCAIYLNHKKEMTLIENELNPQKLLDKSPSPTSIGMGWGLVLTGIGIALFLSGFWTIKPEMWIGGTFFGFIGAALLIFFTARRKQTTPL